VQEGRGVLIARQLTGARGLAVGQLLSLDTLSGKIELPIVGVYTSAMLAPEGDITISRELYREHWKDPTVTHSYMLQAPGVDAAMARGSIQEHFAGATTFGFRTRASTGIGSVESSPGRATHSPRSSRLCAG
jgi:hypothetical protein